MGGETGLTLKSGARLLIAFRIGKEAILVVYIQEPNHKPGISDGTTCFLEVRIKAGECGSSSESYTNDDQFGDAFGANGSIT